MASFGLSSNINALNGRLKSSQAGNVDSNKVGLKKPGGLALRKVNAQEVPLKRNALSQSTNLISKKQINKQDENEKLDSVKVSATEFVKPMAKPILKPVGSKLATVTNKPKVGESRIGLKVNSSISKIPKSTLSKENAIKTRQSVKELVCTNVKPEPKPSLSFSAFLIPENVENIDINDGDNVLLEPGLSNDIYMYIRHLEDHLALNQDFLGKQTQLTPRMRSRLVDWLIAVHHQFKLLPETLYLTIALMDRFFQCEVVSKDKIQLAGVTAFFIASKYEEIYPPDISDFLSICENRSKADLFKMEIAFLRALNFDLSNPLPLHFLRRFSKAAHADSRIHTMAKYLMELSLTEYECAKWRPSLLAASALYLTLQLIGNNRTWNETLVFYSGYKQSELLQPVSIMCKLLLKAETSKYQSCMKKYSSAKLMQISCSKEFKSDYIKEMAAKY